MKIAVLLSGGVDSSVALSRLVAEGGHEITAFYLKIWLEDDFAFLGECPWEDDLNYARKVCAQFGIPLEVVSLQGAYWERVVSHVVAELKAGRTPSPDILCNQRVKFGAFADLLEGRFDKIASGHYATVREAEGRFWLHRGVDPIKDQTYFLSHLSQEQLSRCLFPIGQYPKAQVREMAMQLKLANSERKDSQGICFLGKIKYNEFVKGHLGELPGEIRDKGTDRVLGGHKGYWFHTIGQRKGLGLGGGPWFVVDKDINRNVIYVSNEPHQEEIARHEFPVRALNWITTIPVKKDLLVKIRHGERLNRCEVTPTDTGLNVRMEESDKGVAPGQYAVFYDQDVCLGGGVIAH